MERRSFLKGIAALVGGIALDEAIPLGRIWSFPSTIKCLNVSPIISEPSAARFAAIYYDKLAVKRMNELFVFTAMSKHKPLPARKSKSIQMYRVTAA